MPDTSGNATGLMFIVGSLMMYKMEEFLQNPSRSPTDIDLLILFEQG